jgi:hypothetical protein
MMIFHVPYHCCIPSLIWIRRKVLIAARYMTFKPIVAHTLDQSFLDFLHVLYPALLNGIRGCCSLRTAISIASPSAFHLSICATIDPARTTDLRPPPALPAAVAEIFPQHFLSLLIRHVIIV